jgi:uncharacterized membrane protein YeiB
MFLIFKILPDWFWWILLLTGISAFLLSYFAALKPYHLLLKIIGLVVVALTIFVLGMLYADNTWKTAAQELEAKVAELETKSQQVNEIVKEKLVTKTQVVRVRGEDIVKYINREVVKTDTGCVISPEFINAHNRAAEQPK